MSKRYGLPYMGSKNKIAEWVLQYIPKAENFYDLFCGGCAITHCAMEQRKYKNFFINDIKSEMPQGFLDCIDGKYKGDNRWISHEDFDRLKGKGDLLIDLCFSFGNNWRKGYAYSRDIEPFKRAFHYAIMFDDFSPMQTLYDIDLSAIKRIDNEEQKYHAAKRIISEKFGSGLLESFTRLQNLERLSTLLSMTKLKKPIATFGSYKDVKIKDNSVIYCDIPYRSTAKYNEVDFDYDEFYNWCLNQKQPTYISEYEMPESDFICIAAKTKTCQLCATNNTKQSVERIFIPKHQIQNKPKTLFD